VEDYAEIPREPAGLVRPVNIVLKNPLNRAIIIVLIQGILFYEN
jgi:hypothetical protein